MAVENHSDEYIDEITDRVHALMERLRNGTIHIASHLAEGFEASLRAIRLLPDGRVDPDTVDGRIRSTTLAIRAMKYREDAKAQISIREAQEIYFKLLDREFGPIYKAMVDIGLTPEQAARGAVQDEQLVKQISSVLPDLAKEFKEFWETVGESVLFHIQDGQQLKTNFSGDLFPAHWENVVSTAGLYIDTIVVPCPVIKIGPLIAQLPHKRVCMLLLKHALTAMTYKEIACADISPPIAVVLPNLQETDEAYTEGLFDRSSKLSLRHASYLFGRSFESIGDLHEFCSKLETDEQVLAELKGPDRLIFNADWPANAIDQLKRARGEPDFGVPGLGTGAGEVVFGSLLGRMPQALSAHEHASRLGSTPLIVAETSWIHYTWMLQYESDRNYAHMGAERPVHHLTRALLGERDKGLAWLGNVPPATVLEIRRNGLADEVRNLLSSGVDKLVSADPDDYEATTARVVDNLDKAFVEHSNALLEARSKKLKLYGVDVTSCIAIGAIGVASAYTGNVGLGVASSILGVVGFPNLKDIRSKFAEMKEQEEARRSSPSGFLFRHVKK